jgi:hypothetical protein
MRLTAALACALSVGLVGCVPLGAWPGTFAAAIALLLLLPACFEAVGKVDGGTPKLPVTSCCDIEEAPGSWSNCCAPDLRLTVCWCPPQTTCNYGLGLHLCADGSCRDGADCPDAGVDAGGEWSTCCRSSPDGGAGVTSVCWCEPNVACNYGMNMHTCASGRCFGAFPGVDDGGCQQ